jgi:hypothetical protein
MAAGPDWNLRMVGAAQALGKLPKHADGSVDWGDIRVGHLDTGVTRHPIFGDWAAQKSWLHTKDGWNLVADKADPIDPLDYGGHAGHGTRTCSVICGDARLLGAADGAIVGVAPGLSVVPFRCVNSVLLHDESHRAAVAQGIDRAVRAGCQVISISLGIPGFLPSETGGMGRAVDDAYMAGVIVCAAGGQVIDRVTYPGKYNRTIGCGGLTWQGRIWWDYALGEEMIDVWAPAAGVQIADRFIEPWQTPAPVVEGDDPGAPVSSDAADGQGSSSSSTSSSASSSSSGKLAKSDGTSYATAHVAAAAAMWLRHRGGEIATTYAEPWQRVEAFRTLLKHRTMQRINGRPAMPNGSMRLTIHRLLEASLPKAASLKMATEDEGKSF